MRVGWHATAVKSTIPRQEPRPRSANTRAHTHIRIRTHTHTRTHTVVVGARRRLGKGLSRVAATTLVGEDAALAAAFFGAE